MTTKVVQTIIKLMFPFLLVYGLYIVINGHITPGGGFQGGVFLAAPFVLMLIAFDKERLEISFSSTFMSIAEGFGVILFLVLASLGLLIGGGFLHNWMPKGIPGDIFSSGVIMPINIGIGLNVAFGVVLMALSLSVFVWKRKNGEGI